MSEKKSKKSSDFLAKHLSFGIPTNVAVGPLGFRAELDTDPRGEQSILRTTFRQHLDLILLQC